MAKETAAKKVEKPKKPSIAPEVIVELKASLREKLNALEPAALDRVAKKFNVDVAKYSKLPPALRKMSTVNACLGSAARGVREDGMSKSAVFALVKG